MTPSFDRSTWIRRGRPVAIVVLVLVVVFELFGFFAVPALIGSIAPAQIGSALGRKATIGQVRFNPLTLAATLDDVKVYQADGQAIALQADRLRVDLSSASLFRRALVLDALKITKPVIRVARLADDRFDCSDVLDRLAAQPKSDHPLPYSINNIEVDDGTIDIDDRVGGRRHVVDAIRIGLPFISTLPYDATIFVTPEFHARVDGSTLSLTGKAQPFSATRETAVAFDVADLDLTQYAQLLPATLPFRLESGKLTAQLAIAFRAASKDAAGNAVPQTLDVSGRMTVATVGIADRTGHHAVGAATVAVDLTRLDPIGGAAAIASIAIDQPDVDATRHADGSVDLVDTFRVPSSDHVSASTSASPPAAQPSAQPAAQPAARPQSAALVVGSLTVTRGRARFFDATLGQPHATTLSDIEVQATNIALQGSTPTTYHVALAADEGQTIDVRGNAMIAKRQFDGVIDVKGFKPSRIAPYLADVLAARIDDGTVDIRARYRIDASGPVLAGLVDDATVRVARLRTSLPDEKTTLLGADAIALDGASFDLGKRAFVAESLALTAPVIAVRRDAKGRINLQAAVVTAKPTAPAAASAPAAVEVVPAKASPFTALVKNVSIDRGDVTFDDLALPTPVHVRAQPLNFKATGVGTGADVVPFTLDAGIDKRGKLAIAGKVAPAPLTVDAQVDANQVAVGWLAGYAGDRLNIVVDSADLDTKGALHVARAAAADAPLSLTYRGSLRIARLRSRDRVTSEPFVEWKTLDVPTLDVKLPAATPLSVAMGEVAVTDLYARLIVNANGRLNLQDVVTQPGQRQSVTTPEAAGTPPAATKAPEPASSAPKASIAIAGIRLANGRIGVTDNFIKPNYSATLTDLVGSIAAVSTASAAPSALQLTGRIDGEGTLNVSGSIDPFAITKSTDISAEAKDIELTRLTPYALKYAGYAIDRGKLSMTVKYRIENDRLQASNALFLDQLTFGAHDPSSKADLPVRLAVALLSNSKGEINIELPISGSLSDPQFSIGSVLGRALLNLVARAVTSPFALIGSAFGGGTNGELGYIQFMPGVSDLTPMGRTKLETLAKALADRPALKLDIIGRYDPATDPDGIRRDHLLDRLKDVKAKALSKNGERVGRDEVTIADGAERDRLVAELYDDTKLADKPRNAIGLAKTLPTAEMERLLLADIKLDPNDPRWLAEARADVVRHYIEGTGKIAAGRVFLVTAKLNADGITDKGVPNRVDFAIR